MPNIISVNREFILHMLADDSKSRLTVGKYIYCDVMEDGRHIYAAIIADGSKIKVMEFRARGQATRWLNGREAISSDGKRVKFGN